MYIVVVSLLIISKTVNLRNIAMLVVFYTLAIILLKFVYKILFAKRL